MRGVAADTVVVESAPAASATLHYLAVVMTSMDAITRSLASIHVIVKQDICL